MQLRRSLALTVAASIALLPGFATAEAHAAPSAATTVLTGNVIPGLAGLAPLRATDPNRRIEVSVTLRDPGYAAEQQLVHSLYTKGSPDYHHFLTPAEWASRFAVPWGDFRPALSYATAHGLHLLRYSPVRDLITLAGTVGQAERTFAVQINDYRWHGLSFYANSNEPTVPAGLGIFGVLGLNSAQKMHTFHQAPPASAPHGKPGQDTCDPTGAVCVGITTPEDLRSVYNMPANNQGQGQKLAIFGEGTWAGPIKNLRLFESHFHLPYVPVKVIVTDGSNLANYSDTSGDVEWDLDSQATTGMAPQIQQLDFYFGTSLSDQSVGNMFNVWATDPNGPTQANASFGECEYNPASQQLPATAQFAAGQAFTASTEQSLTEAIGEGRTLFASAGDTGSSCPLVPVNVNGVGNELFPDVNYPCASPEAVCVGGTVLYTTGGDTEASPTATSNAQRVDEY
ncbi:MAG: S53 family peptidase, partial [Mycobacteriales bacterium]